LRDSVVGVRVTDGWVEGNIFDISDCASEAARPSVFSHLGESPLTSGHMVHHHMRRIAGGWPRDFARKVHHVETCDNEYANQRHDSPDPFDPPRLHWLSSGQIVVISPDCFTLGIVAGLITDFVMLLSHGAKGINR
jgi:hypothetical protein